jgi:hypothetical protein
VVPCFNGIIIIGSVHFSFSFAPKISLILLIPPFFIVFFFPDAWIEFNAAYVTGSLYDYAVIIPTEVPYSNRDCLHLLYNLINDSYNIFLSIFFITSIFKDKSTFRTTLDTPSF